MRFVEQGAGATGDVQNASRVKTGHDFFPAEIADRKEPPCETVIVR
jgi:hypothetical protein